MQFDLAEYILVREMKFSNRYRYVGNKLYREFMDVIGTATSEQQGREEATESLSPVLASSNEGRSVKVDETFGHI